VLFHCLFDVYVCFSCFVFILLGFAIGIVTVMQINYTSPLTHNISGTAKACVQTILALMIWRNPTTVNAMLGVFLVIAGSMLYT
jgi:GDP-fucose transporter C1